MTDSTIPKMLNIGARKSSAPDTMLKIPSRESVQLGVEPLNAAHIKKDANK
jgi:hypothetical protein